MSNVTDIKAAFKDATARLVQHYANQQEFYEKEIEKLTADLKEWKRQSVAMAADSAAMLRTVKNENERRRAALRYCGGRMEHPRCPRCAERQQVAKEALQE